MIQYKNINDTAYFWFGLNAITGAGDDGASPTFAVRLAGAASGAAPVYTGTPTLLTHASFTPGSYECVVPATTGNGFAAAGEYGVFSSALVSSVNPTGFVGALVLAPVLSNVIQLGSDAQSATDLKDFADAGYDPATNKVEGVKLVDEIAANGITATSLSAGAMTDISVAVWDATLAGFSTPGTTGAALADASSAGDPWATALPGAYSAGEAGFILGTNLNALITSRMASYTQPTGFLASTFPATFPTNNSIADQVWNEILSGHLGVGSTGEALDNAASAGDPWQTGLPGGYTPGQAGYIVGTYLNQSVSGVPAATLSLFQGDIIPVNIKYVNDIEIKGVGTTIDPWNPV